MRMFQICSWYFIFWGTRISRMWLVFFNFDIFLTSWKNRNFDFLQKFIFRWKFLKISAYSSYECLGLKNTTFAIGATGNSAKKLWNFVKSPVGEINFMLLLGTFFSGKLKFLGPLGWGLDAYDNEQLSDSGATTPTKRPY